MRFALATVIAAMTVSHVSGQAVSGLSITSVFNSFSATDTIAPNTWVSIYGSGLATVQVTMNGQLSAVFPVQVRPYSTAFLTFNGGQYVTATHADGSIVGPPGLYPGMSTPAQPGEEIVLYAAGFGSTSSPIVKGSAVQSGTLPSMPSIQIGGVAANVLFAGLISPGLFQFNVVVPPLSANGDNVLTAQYGGQITQSAVLLDVEFVAISLSNSMIRAGQSATLKWSSINAQSCSASNAWSGSQSAAGSTILTPAAPGYYTYTLTCTGSLQTNSQSVVLTAYGPAPA